MINVVIGPMGSGKSKKMLNMRTGLLLEKSMLCALNRL